MWASGKSRALGPLGSRRRRRWRRRRRRRWRWEQEPAMPAAAITTGLRSNPRRDVLPLALINNSQFSLQGFSQHNIPSLHLQSAYIAVCVLNMYIFWCFKRGCIETLNIYSVHCTFHEHIFKRVEAVMWVRSPPTLEI